VPWPDRRRSACHTPPPSKNKQFIRCSCGPPLERARFAPPRHPARCWPVPNGGGPGLAPRYAGRLRVCTPSSQLYFFSTIHFCVASTVAASRDRGTVGPAPRKVAWIVPWCTCAGRPLACQRTADSVASSEGPRWLVVAVVGLSSVSAWARAPGFVPTSFESEARATCGARVLPRLFSFSFTAAAFPRGAFATVPPGMRSSWLLG